MCSSPVSAVRCDIAAPRLCSETDTAAPLPPSASRSRLAGAVRTSARSRHSAVEHQLLRDHELNFQICW